MSDEQPFIDYWNDMGGYPDDMNYGNDMHFSFSCAGSSTSSQGPFGVVLIQ